MVEFFFCRLLPAFFRRLIFATREFLGVFTALGLSAFFFTDLGSSVFDLAAFLFAIRFAFLLRHYLCGSEPQVREQSFTKVQNVRRVRGS